MKKALALDETCSDAYTALGNFRSVYEFNFPDAKKEYERALDPTPTIRPRITGMPPMCWPR